MEFIHPFPKQLREPVMCTPSNELGLRSCSELGALPNNEIAASFELAMALYERKNRNMYHQKQSDNLQKIMADTRGCETFMAYCIYLLVQNKAATELQTCLRALRMFSNSATILGLVASITGRDVDSLTDEVSTALIALRGKGDVEAEPNFARKKLREVLKAALNVDNL